jgi:hypothetical protein
MSSIIQSSAAHFVLESAKYNKYLVAALMAISFNCIPAFISTAQSQTKNTDYGTLQDIVPIIAVYKKNQILNQNSSQSTSGAAPAIPNPTHPIPITSIPSAPGKYPLVRWLLPGGPPPPAPYLPPLTCTFETCPVD